MKNKKMNPRKITSEPVTHLPVLMDEVKEKEGTFIEDMDADDGFASINTVRYGVEVDVDDI